MPWVPGGQARRGLGCRCCGKLRRVLVAVSVGHKVAVCPECDGVEFPGTAVVVEPLRSAVPREAGR